MKNYLWHCDQEIGPNISSSDSSFQTVFYLSLILKAVYWCTSYIPGYPLLLSHINLRFFQVFPWLDCFFFFFCLLVALNNIPLFASTTVYLSITYWRISWLLPSFGSYKERCHNIHVHNFSTPLDKYQQVWLLDHTARACVFTFVRKMLT